MKPSPQNLHAKLKQILRDAGFQDDNLVEVCSAPVGGHARYVVNILPGKARAALAGTLENVLHRPLFGAFWVFCLDEVQAIISLSVNG
jgi:hypothetical protein